jgi:hypothetical protein
MADPCGYQLRRSASARRVLFHASKSSDESNPMIWARRRVIEVRA